MARQIEIILLLIAQCSCSTFQNRFTVLNGVFLGTVDDQIRDVSLLQCAVFCRHRKRQNRCQTAGYDILTGTCYFSLDSIYNMTPAPNDQLYVMEMFELPTITVPPATTSTTEEGQWVSGVITYSSQYGTDGWSAQQILGVPDVYPTYADDTRAWAPQVIDANQFLEFQFATPVYVTQVDVYETFKAGGVKAINCLDVSGTWITLWSTPQVSVIESARIFSPLFTSTIPCFSNQIRLDIDCTVAVSWVEIDSVRLHGSQVPTTTSPPATTSTI
ncbi:uncharacterized protein LOC127839282 [Dreissena polymorpha]|uniref:uncharacterized protein LOC127839282 n=1 Tax=Dreissena polymorpha TaxID=45954 RepID=UPI002263D492|nr:uncharacterized protein LOC127839282 [Dreissena polymorpha]